MITSELFESTVYDAAFWASALDDPAYSLDRLGGVANDVSNKIRTIACYRLLADGKSDGFYHNLIRSGLVRRRYLQRCLKASLIADHFRGCSRFLPLCDSLTAGDFELARSIVEVSPVEFLDGHEYEDDYCYGRVLNLLVAGEQNQAPPILDRFERYLEGTPNGRFLVAKALIKADASEFEAAFEILLQDRREEIAKNVERGEMESPHIVAARRVFIEGLGILRLAERMGLKTQDEYLYCPSLARVPMVKPFPGE